MCRSCRSINCPFGSLVFCKDCNRTFKSQTCYDQHKKPIGKGSSVCDGIKRCVQCGKTVQSYRLDPSKHLCRKVPCKTCNIDVDDSDNHVCYIQKEKIQEDEDEMEESGYEQLFFFDYEARQEDAGVHEVNLCIVHNESGDEWIFERENTNIDFCRWIFSTQHKNCTFMAHNFQGYDGYFIQKFLNENAIKYDIILRGGKILSLSVPMFNIRFIDSLNFIPMALAKFPSTFGIDEVSKGYFPHLFNPRENQEHVGPIPCEAYYNTNGMKESDRLAFLEWHKEQRRADYVFDFKEEIVKYCRSDVDILRRCCMEFRELFRSVTDIDPFEKCLTIASACHRVYRTNFLKEKTIAVFQSHNQLKVKQSNTAIKWLSYVSEKEDMLIEHVRNGGEKQVDRYSLDGYNPETNTAFEFHGCIWHGCRKCYGRDTMNPVSGRTMQDLHESTMEKQLYLRQHGLNVVEMWECDLKKELEQNEDMRLYFDNHELVDRLQPRDAFYGGRANAAKLFHECKDNEKIR